MKSIPFREISVFLQGKENVCVAILDNNNTQFLSQNRVHFPATTIFSAYDLVLVPGWVATEISDYEPRVEYVNEIGNASAEIAVGVIEEVEYARMNTRNDHFLLGLFLAVSKMHHAQYRFLMQEFYSRVRDSLLPDDWIEQFYEKGFQTIAAGHGRERKPNAGEISALVLTYLLLLRFPQIETVTLFTSDGGLLDLQQESRSFMGKQKMWTPNLDKFGFKSTDLLLVEAFREGRLHKREVEELRTNPRTITYVDMQPDSTTQFRRRLVDTTEFVAEFLTNPHCNILF